MVEKEKLRVMKKNVSSQTVFCWVMMNFRVGIWYSLSHFFWGGGGVLFLFLKVSNKIFFLWFYYFRL